MSKTTIKKETFEITFDEWVIKNSELWRECFSYLYRVLTEAKGNTIDLSDLDFPCCVSYNGGVHPEYASNCFSTVLSVYLKENSIYLSIEDDDCYDINEITSAELYNIAKTVRDVLNDDIE